MAGIRLLVVDDSPLFVETVTTVLGEHPEFQIVGVAANGQQAVELALTLRPDIITMDVHMPVMGGLDAVEHIMNRCPTPILLLTADPRADSGELNFQALQRGALDVMTKSAVWPQAGRSGLAEHLRLLSGVPVVRHVRRRGVSRPVQIVKAPRSERPPPAAQKDVISRPTDLPQRGGVKLVAIVASIGGPSALARILGELPASFPAPIIVVQHLMTGFGDSLASWLNQVSRLEVTLARGELEIAAGRVLLAPDDQHLTVNRFGSVALDASARVNGHRPSATRLLQSVARAYGMSAIGVVLTGMGDDGAAGLLELREAGGLTVAQDEISSVVFGMPRAALETGAASYCLPLGDLAAGLCHALGVEAEPS